MRIGAPLTSWSAVKAAFERNYECMGITCAEVGGLWDLSGSRYFPGATPCSDKKLYEPIAGYVPGSQ
eukprot:5077444-Pleurochrysis_carterae.AAC.1